MRIFYFSFWENFPQNFERIITKMPKRILGEYSREMFEIFPKGPLYIGILKNTLVNVLKEIFEEF